MGTSHLGKTDLVSVAQPLPKIREAFLSKQDKNILSLVMIKLARMEFNGFNGFV